ncbi:MAG: threonine/serine dehydratase [Dehalococcoidia bacterium]
MNKNEIHSMIKNETWTPTPLLKANVLSDLLNSDIWLKREDCTPVKSFKLRGALSVLGDLTDSDKSVKKIVAASAGNYGLAIAEACKRNNIESIIFVPEDANISKIDRIKLTGSEVIKSGRDFDDAKSNAKKYAEDTGLLFLEDGKLPAMHMGAETIGNEIIESNFDYVFVPIGNGSLISGIGNAVKDKTNNTKIIGLVPSESPSMFLALNDENFENQTADTIADGLSVRNPVIDSVNLAKEIVDDVLLVEEDLLMKSMKSFIDYENLLVEPSAAITLAGFVQYRDKFPDQSKICFIITGGLVDPRMIDNIISEKGLI